MISVADSSDQKSSRTVSPKLSVGWGATVSQNDSTTGLGFGFGGVGISADVECMLTSPQPPPEPHPPVPKPAAMAGSLSLAARILEKSRLGPSRKGSPTTAQSRPVSVGCGKDNVDNNREVVSLDTADAAVASVDAPKTTIEPEQIPVSVGSEDKDSSPILMKNEKLGNIEFVVVPPLLVPPPLPPMSPAPHVSPEAIMKDMNAPPHSNARDEADVAEELAVDTQAAMQRLTEVAAAAEGDVFVVGSSDIFDVDNDTLELVFDEASNSYLDPKVRKLINRSLFFS